MPSPLGHALAGVAAGWLVDGAPSGPEMQVAQTAIRTRVWRRMVPGRDALGTTALFACAGIAPDLDLLVGAHSRQSHSIGAALLVTVLAFAATRGAGLAFAATRGAGLAFASGAAWTSHILLDWLGTDGAAPIGIMALWPWSDGFYESSLHVFMAIDRRWWMDHFVSHNLRAMGWELIVLAPVLALVWLARRRPPAASLQAPSSSREPRAS